MTAFFGELIFIFIGLYCYEKLIQRYDPLLRMPWLWSEEDRRYHQAVKRQKKHLRVVK